MNFEKIYKQFNEASLIYKDEYGFEVNINEEWKLVLNDNGRPNIEKGRPLATRLKNVAMSWLKALRKTFPNKEIRLVKGGKNDYYPV